MKWWKYAFGFSALAAWGCAVEAQALGPDFKGAATIDCGASASQHAVVVRLRSGNGKEALGVAIAWADFAAMRNSGAFVVASCRYASLEARRQKVLAMEAPRCCLRPSLKCREAPHGL